MEAPRDIDKKFAQLEDKVDRLLRAVIGDSEMGQDGLAALVRKHDRWIERQKLKEARIIGIGIGLGFVWTALLKLADQIF
jgi:hypothetical protein